MSAKEAAWAVIRQLPDDATLAEILQALQARSPANETHDQPVPWPTEIPPGIRRSQEALRRALPKLLENKKLHGQWVGYHGEECLGIARKEVTLIKECIRRGIPDDSYYIGWIDPSELIEEEEVSYGLCEFDEEEAPPSGKCGA